MAEKAVYIEEIRERIYDRFQKNREIELKGGMAVQIGHSSVFPRKKLRSL